MNDPSFRCLRMRARDPSSPVERGPSTVRQFHDLILDEQPRLHDRIEIDAEHTRRAGGPRRAAAPHIYRPVSPSRGPAQLLTDLLDRAFEGSAPK